MDQSLQFQPRDRSFSTHSSATGSRTTRNSSSSLQSPAMDSSATSDLDCNTIYRWPDMLPSSFTNPLISPLGLTLQMDDPPPPLYMSGQQLAAAQPSLMSNPISYVQNLP